VSGAGASHITLVGNGSATSFSINHNLSSSDLLVVATNASTGVQVPVSAVTTQGVNAVSVSFASPPTTNGVRVMVSAPGSAGFSVPTIRGFLTQTSNLPTTGGPGDMYVVGEDLSLYAWGISPPATTPAWHFCGNTRGEQGPAGPPGTIVGVLPSGGTPPAGTPAGTLWWVADPSSTLPPPDLTPTLVGTSSLWTNDQTLTLPVSSAGTPIVTQDGDVAVLIVTHGSTADVPTPAGFDNPGSTNASYVANVNNGQARIFTRTCPAAMGNISITSGTGKLAASLLIFRNVTLGAGGVVNAISVSASNTSSTSQTAPTVTPTANSIVAGFWFERVGPTGNNTVGATIAAPAAFTSGGNGGITQSTGGSVVSAAAGYDLTVNQTAGRPTGTQTWVKTGAASTQRGAFTLALTKKTS
jgi:hypothetical protein